MEGLKTSSSSLIVLMIVLLTIMDAIWDVLGFSALGLRKFILVRILIIESEKRKSSFLCLL